MYTIASWHYPFTRRSTNEKINKHLIQERETLLQPKIFTLPTTSSAITKERHSPEKHTSILASAQFGYIILQDICCVQWHSIVKERIDRVLWAIMEEEEQCIFIWRMKIKETTNTWNMDLKSGAGRARCISYPMDMSVMCLVVLGPTIWAVMLFCGDFSLVESTESSHWRLAKTAGCAGESTGDNATMPSSNMQQNPQEQRIQHALLPYCC